MGAVFPTSDPDTCWGKGLGFIGFLHCSNLFSWFSQASRKHFMYREYSCGINVKWGPVVWPNRVFTMYVVMALSESRSCSKKLLVRRLFRRTLTQTESWLQSKNVHIFLSYYILFANIILHKSKVQLSFLKENPPRTFYINIHNQQVMFSLAQDSIDKIYLHIFIFYTFMA